MLSTLTAFGLTFEGTSTSKPITPFDFGAFGDGVHDDTAAIQAAINGLAATFRKSTNALNPSGRLYLPAGNYKTSATLFLPPGVELEGNGQGSTVISNITACAAIKAAPVTFTSWLDFLAEYYVSKLTIVGPYAVTNCAAIDMSASGTIVTPHIRDIWTYGYGHGLIISNAVGGDVTSCTFSRARSSAVKTDGFCNNVKFDSVRPYSVGVTVLPDEWPNARGFDLGSCENCVFINCINEGIRGTAYHASNGTNVALQECVFIGCETESFGGNGFEFVNCRGVSLIGCNAWSGSLVGKNSIVIDGGSGISIDNFSSGGMTEWFLKLTNSATGLWPVNVKVLNEESVIYWPHSISNPELVNIPLTNYVALKTGSLTVTNNATVSNLTATAAVSANALSATTTLSIGGLDVLSTPEYYTNLRLGYGALSGTNNRGSVAFGQGAGGAINNGTNNSFFGTRAGSALKTGNNNLFIGNAVATPLTNGSGNIFIGYNNALGVKNATNSVFIGCPWGTEGATDMIILGTGTANSTKAYYDSTNGWNFMGPAVATSISCSPLILSGTAAPIITPAKVGNVYVDTVNKKIYFSVGTASSADWILVN